MSDPLSMLLRNLPRDWTISVGSLHSTRENFDPDEPRDDDGKWTDGGGSGGGEGDGAQGGASEGVSSTSGSSSSGVHDRPSQPYEGTSGGSDGGGGVLGKAEIKQTFTPTAEQRELTDSVGATPITFHELGEGGGDEFHAAIEKAKNASPFGAAVTLYSPDDYGEMRTFLSDDRKTGFALKGDDIISVFRAPDSKAKKAVHSILALAVQEGGRRLDCFDTALPSIYSAEGFKAVGRVKFDPEYKPPGWDYDTFKQYNGGKPDVVFMVFDPSAPVYKKGDGKLYDSYDDGMAALQKAASPKEKEE